MQGLRLITSNRMEDLADGLAEGLRTGAPDPFEPEWVLVQSLGMARWLEQRLALGLGVCAGVEFPFPNAFARRILQAAVPEMAGDAAFNPEALTWRIFSLLPGLAPSPGFEAVAHYLGDGTDARRHFQLSARLGALFDHYLLLRPEVILGWEAGGDAGWQAVLWRALVGDLGLAGRPPAHRARWQAEACRRLRDPGQPVAGLPARVSVFGISTLPPFHLGLLSALASRVPVTVHLLQPCREYWGDIVSGREELRTLGRLGRAAHEGAAVHLERGHRLLASLGAQGRDFLRVIADQPHQAAEDDERFRPAGGGTRLHRLQDDLLDLVDRTRTEPGAPRPVFPEPDDSIQVHNCHGPRRELEVLQDHLLRWFSEDPTLQPRDVLVMLPDVEGYAPLIHGVFGSPERAEGRIPFTVADRSGRAEGRLGEALVALLQMAGSRATAPEVLALLENRDLQRKFGLDPEDLPRLRDWCGEVRIRWGFDAAHRRELGFPELAAGTWRHGLDRLLLGQAMAPGDTEDVGGVVPYPDLEGEAARLAGRWAAFLAALQRALESLAAPRLPDAWAARLEALVDELFEPGADGAAEHREVRRRVGRWREVAAWLDEEHHGAGFLRGGVTFCALKPMRSIPARVICLLGMDDGAFPRRREPAGFDLIAARPQPGDASREADDRYLFLETLISARDRLYLSYVGQSERDNSPRPPSVVVSELLDCLVDSEASSPAEALRVREGLERRHHLQAFHPAYFRGDDRLFSHSVENHQAGRGLRAAGRGGFVLAPRP
ncbi:MAG: exodeoxyribonuclease V subunit gamma, partial [Verrucomicrobiota bacterium]